MAHRANRPALNSAISPTLKLRAVDRREWESSIEPMVAELAATAGPLLRRHRAKIGRWVLEYVGDDDTAHQFFSHHWPSARARETPNAYCYHFRRADDELQRPSNSASANLSQYTMCSDNGRAALFATDRYAHVYEACREILCQLAARDVRCNRMGRLQRPSDAWLLLQAACVEYQPSSGATRTVALLGDRDAGKSVHGYGLSLAKPGNGLISDDLASIHLGTGTAHRCEARLWWPMSMAATYPHLAPILATSPSESLQLSEALAEQVRNCRDAADLARAVESGLIPERAFAALTDHLSHADNAFGMIDPLELLEPDHCLEHSQLTDTVSVTRDAASPWILRVPAPGEFVSRSPSQSVEGPMEKSAHQTTQAQRAGMNHLLTESNIRPALLNSRLPAAQTQFCLRHYLEGRCDSITLLTARDVAGSSLLQTMRLAIRPCDDAFRHDQLEMSFFHGARSVNLVSFERAGSRVELVAFDPIEEGYAQVRAVWPGQVADFFSRHASVRVRELLTEIRNFAPRHVESPSSCR